MAESIFLMHPFERLNYEQVLTFLAQKMAEGSSIEYKREKVEDLPDTIAAMMNTQGGLIFVGVEEDSRSKRPERWEGVKASSVSSGYVESICYAHLEPLTEPPEHTIVKIPDSPDRVILVIRVRAAGQKPINVRDRGLFVRVGDQNRHADLTRLNQWFQERQTGKTAEDLIRSLAWLGNGNYRYGEDQHATVMTALGPIYLGRDLQFSDSFDEAVRGLVVEAFGGGGISTSDCGLQVSIGAIYVACPALKVQFQLYKSGVVHILQGISLPSNTLALSLYEVASALADTQRLVLRGFYRQLCGYTGPLAVGFFINDIPKGGLHFSEIAEGSPDVLRPPPDRQPMGTQLEWHDFIDNVPQDDVSSPVFRGRVLRPFMRQLGYRKVDKVLGHLERFEWH